MNNTSRLRFDGIYAAAHPSGVHFVLRFYANGTVCGGYITQHPNTVKMDFNLSTANHGSGIYTLENTSVFFQIQLGDGHVDYMCNLEERGINCEIQSTVTKQHLKWQYSFFPF